MTPTVPSPPSSSMPETLLDPAPLGAGYRLDMRRSPARPVHKNGGIAMLTERHDIDATRKNCRSGAGIVPAALQARARHWGIDVPARVWLDVARVLAPEEDSQSGHHGAWEASACSLAALAALRACARTAVQNRLTLIHSHGRSTVDLIEEIAIPLWPHVMAQWSGLAEQQSRRLQHLSRTLRAAALMPDKLSAAGVRSAVDAFDELHRIFASAYRQPRNVAGMPSLFASLQLAWKPTLGSIESEAVIAGMRLLRAGGETAPALIGHLTNLLLEQRELAIELNAQPDAIRSFVARASRHVATPQIMPPLAQVQAEAVLEVLLPNFDCTARAARRMRPESNASEHLVLRLRM
ncbi:hypothetical protein FAZ69_03085 [Trinickia terrae]|uniref:Uncharacterized protein n=1 Tax=Trinickia terrae TaxID=2571161 RepID=A0A4U1IGF4_9BURK|nr:hypothetical protein [Trinickia terrae]TKC92665.1 hypothetical protein FAZ69_03085 [Trinickia terrae]